MISDLTNQENLIPTDSDGPPESNQTESIVDRRLEVTRLGFNSSLSAEQRATLRSAMGDPDDRVRAGALGAIVRLSGKTADQGVAEQIRAEQIEIEAAWRVAQLDENPNVRRRASELAPKVHGLPIVLVIELARDLDPTVAEAAAWALGEMTGELYPNEGADLCDSTLENLALSHKDALVREACVAALGARGVGLATILAACSDKPAVRRRAILALSPFEGPEVDAALTNALSDRDWQVRQAAEDLLGIDAAQLRENQED